MNRRRPQFENAVEYLRRLLLRPDMHRGMQLPGVSHLCARAKVSRATMIKALLQLRRQGLIRSVRGHGLFLEQKPPGENRPPDDTIPYEPAAITTAHKWQCVAAQLEKDIFQGRYRQTNKLPGMKTMANTYNTCHQTLRKGIGMLIAKNIIQPARRGYVITPVARKPNENTVYVLMHDFGSTSVYSEAFHDYVRLVEQTCSEMELKLRFLSFRFKKTDIEIVDHTSRFLSNLALRDRVLGIVLGNYGFYMNSFRELIYQACLAGKPVSILDRVGTATQLITGTAAKRTRVFQLGPGTKPGYDVGRFLLMSGHRHVTYISPFHREQWSEDRLTGLRKAYREAGFADGVDCLENEGDDVDSIRNIAHESFQQVRKALSAPEFDYREWFRILPPEERDSKLFPVLRDMASYSKVKEALYPHLKRLLSDTAVSAWVAATDMVATVCMDFLRDNNVKVPARVSVVSFDNSAISVMRGITTYDFNLHKVVHEMLCHIVRPSLSPRQMVVDAPGEIRVRATTR